MFTSERHEEILRRLHRDGKVKVKTMSELFGVSEDCIRKDLRQLEKQGLLRREYGGATALVQVFPRNVGSRKDKEAEAKQEIAQKAYDLIEDGETIFLDISTTNIYLAQRLASGKKRCIIVSNMIDILQILAKNPLLSVIGTGGNVNQELNGFVGAMTIQIIEKHHFDRSFIGTLGVDAAFSSLMTFDLEDGLVKECVISHSTLSYVCMDATKFYRSGNYSYAPLSAVDTLICDSHLDGKMKKKLKESKINFL